MAVVFLKDISTTNLLMAYNNHFVKFYSDTDDKVPVNCRILGIGISPIIIYPHPDGSFLFNLSDYVKSDINTNNFADNLVTEFNSLDAETFTYDVSDNAFLNPTVTFTINFTDNTFESETRTLKFLSGVEQLETYKKNEIIISESNYLILSPVATRTNNVTNIYYWEGYPFEFSFYTNFPDDEFKLINTSNALDYSFLAKGNITSVFLSDGKTDVTIEDFLPLVVGRNVLRFEHNTELQEPILNIYKQDTDCGIYIKFLNKYGRWNYWLLSENHFRNRNSRYFSELENDFSNLEDTISPKIQSGKSAQDSLRCIYERMTLEQKLILESILDSPKIYYFTGERFTRAEINDWIEVSLKTNSLNITKPNTNLYTIELELELPERYMQRL
ncbi:hypothetical protein [Flavobacterium sp.]|uniref:hypothetical protein n=1 Tax=Flavobacterium sp. TaxID=239 RepID=UPI0025BBC3BA|nr:hypothetical protein [Flavobacterium sp.]MBA4155071.1 hypothetical protein [Flavobacterium sp.]